MKKHIEEDLTMQKPIYDPKTDPRFQSPYVDVDEWRERPMPDGSVIPFRYIHGGFEGTGVKFLFCFPEESRYEGRFFQYLSPFPGPDEEVASVGRLGVNDRIGFCLANGAYSVESNMGSTAMFGGQPDSTLCWKASAAVAEYSRIKAMEIYHCSRPYGYVYGGSGGGYKTMSCVENTKAWDGGAPYVIGSPYSLPNTITMHVQGQRVLRNCFDKILDALDAGGSGDPYENLTPEEAQMLQELTKMGFPPIAWYLEAKGHIDPGSLPVLTPGVKRADPSYFEEFWSVPGYMGADPTSTACRDRLQFLGVVKSVQLPGAPAEDNGIGLNGVDDAWKKQLADGNGAWIELEQVPQGENLYLQGVSITPVSGAATGKSLLLKDIVRKPGTEGGYLTIGMCYGMDDLPGVLGAIQPGDTVMLDNSDYIAIQSYYRHQCPPDLDFHAWDQFRNPDGTPAIPQRSFVMGPGFTGTGMPQDGQIQCKIINIQALMDESTCPWCADWYRKKILSVKGNLNDHRVYFMERCMHGDTDALTNYMVVNYMGALRQALMDLSAWVEKGIEPVPSTAYVLGEDGQIHPEQNIQKRFGLQSVVHITANGSKCARVKAGEAVRFEVDVQVPLEAGQVTGIEFADKEYSNKLIDVEFPHRLDYVRYESDGIHGAKASMVLTYDQPGTYFATVRVSSNREGDPNNPYFQILNLDRVRIIVE